MATKKKKPMTKNQKERERVLGEMKEMLRSMKSNAENVLATIDELQGYSTPEEIIDNLGDLESEADSIAEEAKNLECQEFPEDDGEESEAAE